MIFTITILFLSIVAAIIGIFAIIASTRIVVQRAILITLHLIAIMLIVVAIIEPTIQWKAIMPPQKSVAILYDVSQSMTLFPSLPRVNSYVDSLVRQLREAGLTPQIYAFGDSTRKADLASLKLTDATTQTPTARDNPLLEKSKNIILVSDGNWYGEPNDQLFTNKEVWWLDLDTISKIAWLKAEAETQHITAAQDSVAHAIITLSGYSLQPDTLDLYTASTGHHRQVYLPAGAISDTIHIQIDTRKPGRTVTSISVQQNKQTISKVSLVVTVLPSRMTYAIQSSMPSLDRRFLAVACNPHTDLTAFNANKQKKPDILFLHSPTTADLARISKLPVSSTICVIGPMPGDSISLPYASQVCKLSALAPLMQISNVVEIPNLPSPTSIIIPHTMPKQILATFEIAGKFTQPLLLYREYSGRTILQLCATGIWRWEFWPLGSLENHQASLCNAWLLPLLKNTVLRAQSENLCIISTTTQQGDSLNIDIFPPASIPENTTVNFSLAKIGTEKRFIDTSFTIFPTLSGFSHLTTAPPASGFYALSAILQNAKTTCHFSDTIFVPAYHAEKGISGMNTTLLSSIGTMVNSDPASMTRTISAALSSSQLSIEHKKFAVRRCWQLLALIIGALGTGWYLRRRWNIDS